MGRWLQMVIASGNKKGFSILLLSMRKCWLRWSIFILIQDSHMIFCLRLCFNNVKIERNITALNTQGNRRTPDKFVGREAMITSQCLNGWYGFVYSGDLFVLSIPGFLYLLLKLRIIMISATEYFCSIKRCGLIEGNHKPLIRISKGRKPFTEVLHPFTFLHSI